LCQFSSIGFNTDFSQELGDGISRCILSTEGEEHVGGNALHFNCGKRGKEGREGGLVIICYFESDENDVKYWEGGKEVTENRALAVFPSLSFLPSCCPSFLPFLRPSSSDPSS
jgi:hypothetical protein